MSATCSPGWMARHTSTALLAPASSSVAPYGDALLRHPAAVALRDRAGDRRVPFRLARFPSERDACAPVLVVWLDHKLIAVRAQEREQIHGGAATRNRSILDESRPRNMPANDLALVGREEPGMTLIGEHREKGLLVRDLAAQRVGHADDPLLVRIEESTALALAGD